MNVFQSVRIPRMEIGETGKGIKGLGDLELNLKASSCSSPPPTYCQTIERDNKQ